MAGDEQIAHGARAARAAYDDAANEVHREARWQAEQGNPADRWLMVEGILRGRAAAPPVEPVYVGRVTARNEHGTVTRTYDPPHPLTGGAVPPSAHGAVVALLALPMRADGLARTVGGLEAVYGPGIVVDFHHPLSGTYMVLVRPMEEGVPGD